MPRLYWLLHACMHFWLPACLPAERLTCARMHLLLLELASSMAVVRIFCIACIVLHHDPTDRHRGKRASVSPSTLRPRPPITTQGPPGE